MTAGDREDWEVRSENSFLSSVQSPVILSHPAIKY
jgi:hypothetical protein